MFNGIRQRRICEERERQQQQQREMSKRVARQEAAVQAHKRYDPLVRKVLSQLGEALEARRWVIESECRCYWAARENIAGLSGLPHVSVYLDLNKRNQPIEFHVTDGSEGTVGLVGENEDPPDSTKYWYSKGLSETQLIKAIEGMFAERKTIRS